MAKTSDSVNEAKSYSSFIANNDIKFAGDVETLSNADSDDGIGGNNTKRTVIGSGSTEESEIKTDVLPELGIFLPQWGYSDFMTERLNWQKGLNDIGGEPGWFYFRVFFHFNTAYGLFGGQLSSGGAQITNKTCAKSFFELWKDHYPTLDMYNREKSLNTFCNMLNNISNNTPWFFHSISGMDKASVTNMNEPFKDNTLEIKCLEESIDMRLSTLFEYYKYACFDYINLKEIIPENLRKFDMSVVVFGVPIRYLDTHSKINGKEYQSRTIRGENGGNKMTMSMYTFKECEFDTENMAEPMPADMSNEHAFQNNNISIKIKYKKVFNYKQNGFGGTAISPLGMINKTGSDMSSRLGKMSDAFKSMRSYASGVSTSDNFVDKFIGNKTQFSKWYKFARSQGVGSSAKMLIDETEAICQDYYSNVAHSVFNTVVGKGVLGASELGSITPPDKGVNTDYYKETLNNIYKGTIKHSDTKRKTAAGLASLGIRTFKVDNTQNNQSYKNKLVRQ